MNALHDLVQGSAEWHAHRAKYRNASEAPSVMEVSPWVSPYQLWELKTGRRVQEVNFAMQRGTDLEPAARAAYEDATGFVMEPCVMVDGSYSASLDGISLDGGLILEVKCPLKGQQSETWQLAEAHQIPEHYYWQVQHQLMVTKAAMAHFYVFDGERGLLVEVLPDREGMDRLRLAWDGFMEFVATDTPPPLTEQDTVTRSDQAWQMAVTTYLAAKQAGEEAVKVMEAARSQLVDLTRHTSEKGFGVMVSCYWKGGRKEGAGKQEVRVTVCREGV